MKRLLAVAAFLLVMTACSPHPVTWSSPVPGRADCFYVRMEKRGWTSGTTVGIAGPFCGKQAKLVREFIGEEER